MTLARRKASAPRDLEGPAALDLQRFTNAGRLLEALSDELLSAVGMAHHDVGFLCELLPRGGADEQVRDAAAEARTSLFRAAAGVSALLSVARPRGLLTVPLRVVEVAEAALFDLQVRLVGLSVVRDLSTDAWVLADRGTLLQSLVSLLLDAADAAEPRGHIRVALREESGHVSLSIEDDGPAPLSPESLPEQANTPLWICRNVLLSIGATLSVGIGPLGGKQVTIGLRAA